jgi:hypothetical protein
MIELWFKSQPHATRSSLNLEALLLFAMRVA